MIFLQGQVKKWHQKQVKKYEEFLDRQEQQEQSQFTDNHSQNSRPEIFDGDVTCTGGTIDNSTSSQEDKNDDNNNQHNKIVEDPGPMPQNIYNRGFIQNWKEVFFPISLQKKAAAAVEPVKDKHK